MLTKQMLQRFVVALLAQNKAGNNTECLKNKIEKPVH